MIRELSIKNYALIPQLRLTFDKGFSVFTGETGAGKSILIGAIGLLLGERASTESVRSGSDETEINGIFELNSIAPALAQELKNADIPCEDNILIIRRIIAREGKNRIHINQIPIPLSTLKIIGNHLVDMHGQHEHQSLLRQETANILINSLPELKDPWENYSRIYHQYQQAKSELEAFIEAAVKREQQRDIIEFQYNEIAQLQLQENEEHRLEQEYTLLSTVTQRCECASVITSIIDGDGSQESLERQISKIKRNLEILQKFDTTVKQWLEDIESSSVYFSELSSFCNTYLQSSESSADPSRLEHINSRIAKIQRLKKKHLCDFNSLLEKQKQLKTSLDAIGNTDSERAMLEKKLVQAELTCRSSAEKLSTARKKVLQHFDFSVTQQMQTLGFNGGAWNTAFVAESALTPNGLETAVFEVRTNMGEPFLPLIRTASGGEISRLMLAIKTILARRDDIPVLIFDEIDSGISGFLAKEVARALNALSKTHQVICISHLHQIASIADNHYRVYKTEYDNRTISQVHQLAEKEKVEEISRMLGSDSAISKKHAQELLTSYRENIKEQRD